MSFQLSYITRKMEMGCQLSQQNTQKYILQRLYIVRVIGSICLKFHTHILIEHIEDGRAEIFLLVICGIELNDASNLVDFFF